MKKDDNFYNASCRTHIILTWYRICKGYCPVLMDGDVTLYFCLLLLPALITVTQMNTLVTFSQETYKVPNAIQWHKPYLATITLTLIKTKKEPCLECITEENRYLTLFFTLWFMCNRKCLSFCVQYSWLFDFQDIIGSFSCYTKKVS